MTTLALRVADAFPTRWATVRHISDPGYRSTHTSTWSRVKEAPPSAPATTNVADSSDARSATWIAPVVERLNHLLQLEDGWGGPGTLKVDLEVVQKTIETLARIAGEKTRPPSISPGFDGSLQLAWYTREFELEIDIPRSGDLTASLFEHASGEESELSLASPQLYRTVERLAAD